MAQVPEPNSPSIAPSAAPTPYQDIRTSPLMFGAGIAQAVGDIGKQAEQAGDMLASHAVAFQQISNKIVSDQGYADYVTKVLSPTVADYSALQGQKAWDAYQPTLAKLESDRQAASEAMPNTPARIMFDEQTRRMLGYEAMSMANHAREGRDTAQLEATSAALEANRSMAASHWNDPRVADSAIKDAGTQIALTGAIRGWTPDVAKQKLADETSAIRSAIVERMNDANPRLAQEYYRQHYDDFNAVDGQRIGTLLKASTNHDDALSLVHSVVNGVGTADVKKLVPAIQSVESGGGQSLIGPETRTGSRSEGIMQLQPDTARTVAKELGLPFDPQRLIHDNEYNTQLGTQYLNDLLRRYNGNQTLALAAYNAGPGAVDKWIGEFGDPSKGDISDEMFANRIPFPETRDYVQKVTDKAGGFPSGTPATNIDINAHYPDWQEQVHNAVMKDPLHAGDDQYEYFAQNALTHYVTQMAKAQHDTQVSAFRSIDQLILGNQLTGQKPATDWGQVFNQQGMRQAWAALTPEQQKVLVTQMNENISGPKAVAPAALEHYHTLLGEFHNDPAAFSKENLAGMMDLPTSMRRELIDKQAEPEKHIDENIQHALGVSSGQLSAAGITKSGNVEEFNKFTGVLTSEIDSFIAVHNRRPNNSDIQKMTATLLTKNGMFSGYTYQQPGVSLYGKIPETEAAAIVRQHERAFGSEPNEGQIAWWYNRMHPNGK